MTNKASFYKSPRNLLYIAGGLLLGLLLLEGWLYYNKPVPPARNAGYLASLDEATQIFNAAHDRSLQQTQQLANQLETQLQTGSDPQQLHQYVAQYPSFWGITLFGDTTTRPLVWDGFAFTSYPAGLLPPTSTATPHVDVIRQNNVISLLCRVPISIQDSSGTIGYELITTTRLRQKNALAIGQSHEFDLLAQQQVSLQNPVEFSFFESFPDSVLGIEVLSTSSRDSVGVAYIPPGKYSQALQQWSEMAWFWRSVFAVFAYGCIALFVYLWIGALGDGRSLAGQLLVIALSWMMLGYFEIPARWIPEAEEGAGALYHAAVLAKHSLFAFFMAETVARFLDNRNFQRHSTHIMQAISAAAVFGISCSLIITFVVRACYTTLGQTRLSLFDLEILPTSSTFFVFLSLALLLFSVCYGLVGIGSYLLQSDSDSYHLTSMISTISFLIGLILLQLYLPASLVLNWATWLTVGVFAVILAVSLLRVHNTLFITSLFPIRGIVIGSFAVALLGYPILKFAQFSAMDNQLIDQTSSFLVEEDSTARNVTEKMLNTLQDNISGVTEADLNERVPFLQSTFNQTIEQTLTPDLRTYSFNLQLIKPEGEIIADYATDLNAPNWTTVFDLNDLSAATDIERITKNSNRPIVQRPQLENGAQYTTFYRGWIPIFSPQSDERIAWILCSVYREHPDFDKPIRAVLASLTYADLDESYLLLEYQDGQLVRSSKRGMAGHFPYYSKLLPAERNALSTDSVLYYSSSEFQQPYRNVLVQTAPQQVIKASMPYPSLKNELFAFFRFSFSLLLAALLLVPPYLYITAGNHLLRGAGQRFEHRILDSFLVATLLFLGLLIATTHYAIGEQNKEIVRQDLFDKLQQLASSTQNSPQFTGNEEDNATFSIHEAVAPMNVDAAFYDNNVLLESTTPQIYQQNLLPSILPFDVFNTLYLRHKNQTTGTVELASQNLLIGYQSLHSSNQQPIATLAIPTFLESPKYDQQLLETISYLVVLYLFTFGIFILATAIIAKRVTEPLRAIQQGLNNISDGDLDTKIPVKSDDELGSLAEAYNEMVDRLKQVRKELAIAERQAAWKEMAQQVAHEIKNPLTPMKLNIQHLERQLANGTQDLDELTSNIKKITANLTEQIQTLNNIASDFSKFSKPIESDFSKVNINPVIHSVAELYRQDEQIKVNTQLTDYPIHVSAVQDELKRVFINLVKNAFEAMPEQGGTITVKSYIKKDSAFFEVEDNGTGISEEDKSKIFVPNFSTKSSGTGLGLAICKKIIEAHEGSITFASIKGQGTTFIIKLPLRRSQD